MGGVDRLGNLGAACHPTHTMTAPKSQVMHVDKHGRIVIPAEIRDALGLAAGEKIVLRVKDGRLEVENLRQSIARHAGIARRMGNIPDNVSIVDEFIAERRAEAARGE